MSYFYDTVRGNGVKFVNACAYGTIDNVNEIIAGTDYQHKAEGFKAAVLNKRYDTVHYLARSEYMGEKILSDAINWAFSQDNVDLADYLLDELHGNNKCDFEDVLISLCLSAEGLKTISYLISTGVINLQTLYKYLRALCEIGNLLTVEYLTQNWSFTVPQLNEGLLYACKSGYIDIVRHLVSIGADNLLGAMKVASSNDNYEIAVYLSSVIDKSSDRSSDELESMLKNVRIS